MRYLVLLLLSVGVVVGQVMPTARKIVPRGLQAAIVCSGGSLTNDLQVYYTLDEVSGNRMDSWTNAQTLTDVNTVTSNTGVITNAAQFASSNSEALTRGDSVSLSTGNINYTFTAWVKLYSLVNMAAIAKASALNQDEYRLDYNLPGTAIRFLYENGANTRVANITSINTTNVWYFVAAWHDTFSGGTLYIDLNAGQQQSNVSDSGIFPLDTTQGFALGGRIGAPSPLHWDGLVDEVGFWKRILTTDEIQCLYDLTRPSF